MEDFEIEDAENRSNQQQQNLNKTLTANNTEPETVELDWVGYWYMLSSLDY